MAVSSFPALLPESVFLVSGDHHGFHGGCEARSLEHVYAWRADFQDTSSHCPHASPHCLSPYFSLLVSFDGDSTVLHWLLAYQF